MNRVLAMALLTLIPRLLAAQPVDISRHLGEDWYGLYLNGQKSGYATNSITRTADGEIVVVEDAQFKIVMNGLRQDMRMMSKNVFSEDGTLKRVELEVDDPTGRSSFIGIVDGDGMNFRRTVGGKTEEMRLPKPVGTLRDALGTALLVEGGAKVGDSISYVIFEPMKQDEITVRSEILGVEDRVFEGVPTKVYKIKTHLESMNIDTISYVNQDGTTLEDITAGMITKRLEPKEIARDVTYSNDVIVANAAMVDRRIPEPRTRGELRLKLDGPITTAHLFNDERQFFTRKGDSFEFTGRTVSLEGFTPAHVPVTEPSVTEWLKPTVFVQSEDERIVSQAREIIGEETDAMKVTELLCRWVYRHVHSTYSSRLSNALEVLENPTGDCTEHSILFIALARAAGLPAREVAGLIYIDDDDKPGFYFHQWAKVWIGKWIDVDPTFDQPLADATHIKLGEGDLFQQAQLIPLIGRIQIEVLDSAKEG